MEIKLVKLNAKSANVICGGQIIADVVMCDGKVLVANNDGTIYQRFEPLVTVASEIKSYIQSECIFKCPEDVLKNEWILEQFDTQTKKFKPIGKVLLPMATKHLSRIELEEIWSLANFGCSFPKRMLIDGGAYNLSKVYVSNLCKYIGYMPLQGAPSAVNSDVFIRPHNNLDEGYFIRRVNNTDEWQFSKTRQDAANAILENYWFRG